MFVGRGVFVFKCERSLGAFDGDAIIVDGVGGVLDGDVLGGVDVGAVGGGRFGAGFDVDAVDGDAVAVIDVEVPEAGVFEVDIFDEDVVGVLDEDEARAGDIEVLGIFVGREFGPEGVPEGLSGAVEGAFAVEDEVVVGVGVDECGEPFFEVAFDAGSHGGVVGDVGGAFEDGVFVEMEIDAGLEENGAGEEGAGGDDDGAAAGLCEGVDGGLDGFGVERGGVGESAVIGDFGGAHERMGWGKIAGGEGGEGEGGGDEGADAHWVSLGFVVWGHADEGVGTTSLFVNLRDVIY